MSNKAIEHVRQYNIREDGDASDEAVAQTVLDAKVIWSNFINSRRWWDDTFNVVEIDGMLIGYDGADTTGDENATEKGWDFDPSSICEVVAKEVVKTMYMRA